MKENLSYHMARHSFGTLMLSSGIPIESIAKMMGHRFNSPRLMCLSFNGSFFSYATSSIGLALNISRSTAM